MDPITLATVTSAVTVLATECVKGVAGSAGKDLWTRIKGLLGWTSDPKLPELAPAIAERLQQNEELARQIVVLLKDSQIAGTSATPLVGNIDAEKVVVASHLEIAGDFIM